MQVNRLDTSFVTISDTSSVCLYMDDGGYRKECVIGSVFSELWWWGLASLKKFSVQQQNVLQFMPDVSVSAS